MSIDAVGVLTGAVPGAVPSIDIVQDVAIAWVRTTDGRYGFGESQSSPSMVRAVIEARASRTFPSSVAELVVGRATSDVEMVMDDLATSTAIIGGSGLVVHALSALEQALWDLRGKIEGAPVWKLLAPLQPGDRGPRPYATVWAPELSELPELARRALADGLAGLKVAYTQAGPPGGDEIAYLREVRRAVGRDFDVMLDLQSRADPADLLSLLDGYAEVGIRWIEEPFGGDRFDLYEDLAARTPIALAAGERETSPAGFSRLLSAGVTVIQPDLGRCGGLAAGVKVAQMAAAAGAMSVPHGWSTDLNHAVNVHWALATGNDLIERCYATSPLPEGLVKGAPVLVAGRFRVPDRPGLGIDVDTTLLQRGASA